MARHPNIGKMHDLVKGRKKTAKAVLASYRESYGELQFDYLDAKDRHDRVEWRRLRKEIEDVSSPLWAVVILNALSWKRQSRTLRLKSPTLTHSSIGFDITLVQLISMPC